MDREEPPPDVAANEQLFLGATAARLIVNDTLAVALVTEKPRATYVSRAGNPAMWSSGFSGVRPPDVGPRFLGGAGF